MSRIHTQLTPDLTDYIRQVALREPEVLRRQREGTDAHPHASMQTAPEQGQIRSGSPERVSPFAHERLGEYKPVSVVLQTRAYYLRFRVKDRPGILAGLSGILAAKNISLEAVLQLPTGTKRDLPFVITVEPTYEHAIREAVAQMAQLDFLLEPPL